MTVPSATTCTGVPSGAAMSIPSWFVRPRRPKPELMRPSAGQTIPPRPNASSIGIERGWTAAVPPQPAPASADASRNARPSAGAPRSRRSRRVPRGPSARKAILPEELHEPAVADDLLLDEPRGIDGIADERLRLLVAERHDEPAARAELAEKRARRLRGRRGDDDRVVGRLRVPADRAVADLERDVVEAEVVEDSARARRERREALDGVDVPAEVGQDGRLIARAGPHLEDPLPPGELEGLGHERNGRGMRDRLPVADRERVVVVGAVAERLVDEEVPWDEREGREDAAIAHAALGQLLDHALSRMMVRRHPSPHRPHLPLPALSDVARRRQGDEPPGTRRQPGPSQM